MGEEKKPLASICDASDVSSAVLVPSAIVAFVAACWAIPATWAWWSGSGPSAILPGYVIAFMFAAGISIFMGLLGAHLYVLGVHVRELPLGWYRVRSLRHGHGRCTWHCGSLIWESGYDCAPQIANAIAAATKERDATYAAHACKREAVATAAMRKIELEKLAAERRAQIALLPGQGSVSLAPIDSSGRMSMIDQRESE